jgi:hypothetical protein
MAVLAKTVRFSLLVSAGSAAMLGQPMPEDEVGFDSVRRQVSQSGALGDDDPIRRQLPHQTAGSHGDGFIHRDSNVAITLSGAASMLEMGSEEARFKAHMTDLMGHGMHRHILEYSKHGGWACETTGDVIDVNMTMVKCKASCDRDLDCSCYQYDKSSVTCALQKAASCTSDKCKRSGSTDVYIQKAIWAKDPLRLLRHQGMDCRDGKGATELDAPEAAPSDLSLQKCKERCGHDEECTCFKWDRTTGHCLKMKECRTRECAKSGTIDTYLHEAVYNGYVEKHSGTDW